MPKKESRASIIVISFGGCGSCPNYDADRRGRSRIMGRRSCATARREVPAINFGSGACFGRELMGTRSRSSPFMGRCLTV